MIILGYRVYKFIGKPKEYIFIEAIKLEQYPNLIFVKDKKQVR